MQNDEASNDLWLYTRIRAMCTARELMLLQSFVHSDEAHEQL
jgi:hypothetical protein